MAEQTSDHERLNLQPIRCVSTLLSNIEKIEKDQEWSAEQRALQYYRGLSNDRHKLKPSVMRDKKHYANEGEMLRDLMTRQPDQFSKFVSALDRWTLAQHHGLYTRFLDISTNPLVGLFFTCNDPKNDSKNGLLYVFATTRDRVKPYDSDSVSIVANFARLRRKEQEEIREETKKFLKDAFITSRHQILLPNDKDVKKEVRCYATHMKESDCNSYMGRLHTFIKQEKPYFIEDLIQPRDLFRIFIVQPRRLFPRVTAQSGAFLVSASHKTFDFEGKERRGRYRARCHDIPYNYYRLEVTAGCKESIREELKSLNISRETLFPELEESAKAILKDYESRQESELKDQIEAIGELRRAKIRWSVIQSATGIDERTYRTLERDLANCTRSRPPR